MCAGCRETGTFLAPAPQLIKRLEELKEEKEKLALEVDREEEFLTNTLQKKLVQVRGALCVCVRVCEISAKVG